MRTSATLGLLASAALVLSAGRVATAEATAATTPSYGVTWTVDPADSAVVEYAAGASGAATPIASISGGATDLDTPSGVAMDSAGNVYVANAGNSSITEYAKGATGDVAPIETIAGASTGLSAPSSIGVSDGLVWVTNPTSNLVEAFSADSGGDVFPAETISGPKTLLDHPVAVAANEFGGLWVANHPATGLPSLENFDGVGNLAPEARVHSANSGLQSPTALIPSDFFSIVVTDSATDTVSEFEPLPGLPGADRPVMRIRGAATGLDQPDGIAIDAIGRLVVANAGSNSLEVFGPNASGNAKPLRSITGVGGAGGPASVSVLAAVPGAPTHVRVHAHNGSARLTWDPPADTGGGISGYDAYAFPIPSHPASGGYVTSSSDYETTRTSITVRHLTNGVTYLFQVDAHNVIGQSDPLPVALTATPYGPPGSPRGVTAVPGSRSLQVFWAAPALNGGKKVTTYVVQYATCRLGAAGCKPKTRRTAGSKRTLQLTGLTPGVRYHVRVIAKTSVGVGKPSKVATATVA
jgi:Fibronectin type III domain/NHL repeat